MCQYLRTVVCFVLALGFSFISTDVFSCFHRSVSFYWFDYRGILRIFKSFVRNWAG